MPAKVTIQCPDCFAKLNLPDRSKLGKKIKCPKCESVFVAEAGDEDNLNEEEEVPSSSRRKKEVASSKGSGSAKGGSSGKGSASSKAKKKGAAKNDGGGNKGLLIGGAVVGLLALVGLGLFLGGFFGGGNPPVADPTAQMAAPPMAVAAPQVVSHPMGLGWMPAETDVVIHGKVSDLLKAPVLKSLVESPDAAKQFAEMQTATGLVPADIDSFTVGLIDLNGAIKRAAAAGSPPGAGPGAGLGAGPNPFAGVPTGLPVGPNIRPEDQRQLVIIRSLKPIDSKAVMAKIPNSTVKERNGKSYFESTSPNPVNTPPAGWFPNETTLIVGSLADVTATIDRGETITPRAEFKELTPKHHLTIAGVLSGFEPPPPPPGVTLPPKVVEQQEKMKKYAMNFGTVELSVRGGFEVQVSVNSATPEGAALMKGDIDTSVNDTKQSFGFMKVFLTPPLGDLADTLLNQLKVEQTASTLKVSTQIPDSDQAKLEQAPTAIAKMMGSFMGTPAGGPAANTTLAGTTPPDSLAGSNGSVTFDLGSKLPGETAPVQPTSSESLPEGLTITAQTAWARSPELSPDGKSELAARLVIDLEGDSLANVCAFGNGSITTLVGDGGVALKPRKAEFSINPDPLQQMISYDRSAEFQFDHPEGKLRVVIPLETYADTVKKVASLEGTLKLMMSKSSEEFTIDDARKTALRPLTNPTLKEAGVKLLLSKEGAIPAGTETFKLSVSKPGFYIGTASATVPGGANTLTMFFLPDSLKSPPTLKLTPFDSSGKFADNLQIKFKLHKETSEVIVSFKFAGLSLPDPALKPKAQTGQGQTGLQGLPPQPAQPAAANQSGAATTP